MGTGNIFLFKNFLKNVLTSLKRYGIIYSTERQNADKKGIDKMEKLYFVKAWLLSQIIYDTENTAKVTAKMVAEGEVPLDYVLNMPDTLIEELQAMSLILGRDWEKDVESFKEDGLEKLAEKLVK